MVWVTTEAFFVMIEIFCPALRQKFCVATRLGAGPGLGHDKGLLVSQQSFPRAGPFLSRQKILCRDRVCRGGVAIESFLVVIHRPGLHAQ